MRLKDRVRLLEKEVSELKDKVSTQTQIQIKSPTFVLQNGENFGEIISRKLSKRNSSNLK